MADVRGVVAILVSVANEGHLNVSASAGEECMIINLYFGGSAELSKYDGGNEVLVENVEQAGSRLRQKYMVTNNVYLRIKNTSGNAEIFGYDGVRTK